MASANDIQSMKRLEGVFRGTSNSVDVWGLTGLGLKPQLTPVMRVHSAGARLLRVRTVTAHTHRVSVRQSRVEEGARYCIYPTKVITVSVQSWTPRGSENCRKQSSTRELGPNDHVANESVGN
ncbi:hypothetical protein J6590_020052 [Homalodisca vitripennis]|nr:hypothetical protein J6590_020052 [Homalodisca vitripennis]